MQIKTIQSVHYCMLYQCTLYSILYIRSFIYLLFISFSKQLNFVWGEKQNTHIPPPPVGHMIDWRRAEVRDPIHSRTQMPSEFTSLRNDQCQKHFIIPFTHRVGWAGRKYYFSLKIPVTHGFPACPNAPYVILPAFLNVVFTCWI